MLSVVTNMKRHTKSSKRRKTLAASVLVVVLVAFPLLSQWALNVRVTRQQDVHQSLLRETFATSPLEQEHLINRSDLAIGDEAESLSRLDAYDPRKSPVFPNSDEGSLPLKVGIVTISPLVGEAMHFLYDGVVRSDRLELVGTISLFNPNATHESQIVPSHSFKPTDADLWILDGGRVAKLQRDFLVELIESKQPSWKVLFVDFTDKFPFQLRKYNKLRIWDPPHIRLAVRSITIGRNYDAQNRQIFRGKVAISRETAGGPTLHAPYAVRTDIVGSLWQTLETPINTTDAIAEKIFSPAHSRPMDVVHMWNVVWKAKQSKFRNDVSRLVRGWNGTLEVRGRLVASSVNEQGERRKVGRNTVDLNYVKALLSSKIVVVTQKDDWEDHYRLFESLSCGALVIHDRMLAPPTGLVSGENLVFFDNLTQLEQLVSYYLDHDEERERIARKGWEISMGRHRSWHRMEELVFGRPLTGVATSLSNA